MIHYFWLCNSQTVQILQMWLSRKFSITWCEALIDWHFCYWNNIIPTKEILPLIKSNNYGKTQSSCVLNVWKIPNLIPYDRKFCWRIYFGRLAVVRAIIHQKLHSVMSSLLQNHGLCTRLAAKPGSLIIIGIEFTIESYVRVLCIEGEELACLSTWEKWFKLCVHGRCKDRRDKNSPD